MTGDVGLSLILPESDGHAEDWAQDEIETALEEVCEGLVFLADYRMDTNLTFWLPEAVLVKPTSVEPVEENYDEHKWVEDIMEDLGYDCSYFPFFPKFNRRRCNYLFNDDKRAQYELDWYFTSYVIRDVNSDHFFKDGHFSVSWPWGPYSWILYTSAGDVTGLSDSFAHETMHIFGAEDEYDTSDCSCGEESGYLHEPNNNCRHCPGGEVPCIMDRSKGIICQWSQGQVGWRDSDDDGLIDPFDVNTYWTQFVGDPFELAVGDYLDAYYAEDWVKRIQVTERNMQYGQVTWNFLSHNGGEIVGAPIGWTKNGGGPPRQFYRGHYSQAPVILSAVVDPCPGDCTGSGSYQGYHQMSLEFYDDALCSLVQARVYPSGHPELVEVFLLNQEFKYSTADANPPTATLDPITKVFYLKDPGPYTCEVNVWDVNGGEKTRTYVSFMRLGGIVSVAGKETIRGLSLSAATPNPFSGRVQWHLASKRAQDLELSIVRVDGRVVRAWSETVVAGERKSIVWDGRNSLGQRVPVGMYYLQVRGRHEQREVKSVIYMY